MNGCRSRCSDPLRSVTVPGHRARSAGPGCERCLSCWRCGPGRWCPRRLGLPETTSYAAYVAGDLARLDGDFTTARERLESAARVAETQRDGLARVTAVTFIALGYLAAAEEQLAAARDWHDRALATALPTGDSPIIAQALTGAAHAT